MQLKGYKLCCLLEISFASVAGKVQFYEPPLHALCSLNRNLGPVNLTYKNLTSQMLLKCLYSALLLLQLQL